MYKVMEDLNVFHSAFIASANFNIKCGTCCQRGIENVFNGHASVIKIAVIRIDVKTN